MKKTYFNKKQWTLFGIVLTLLILRALAPWAGEKYVNHVLANDLENYQGSIEDFDLHLIRGQYTLEGFVLYKKTVPEVAFVKIERSDISINWSHLFQGELLMDIALYKADVTFVDGSSGEKDVAGTDESKENWKAALDEIVPLSIQSLRIKDSSVDLKISALKGLVASHLGKINGVVSHLVDPDLQRENLSPFDLKAELNGHAPIQLNGGVNIVNPDIPFDVNGGIGNFRLASTNELLKYYVPIDIQNGEMDVIFETYGSVPEGRGYFKTFFKDLEVFGVEKDYVSTRHVIFEYLGGFGNWLINAITEGEVATEIPFLWTPAGFDADSSEAFWSLIENSGDNLKKTANHIGPLEPAKKKKKDDNKS